MRECLVGVGRKVTFAPFSCLPGLACPTAHFFGPGDNDAVYTQGVSVAVCFCERASPLFRD